MTTSSAVLPAPANRRLGLWAGIYVLAWVIGLATGPTRPAHPTGPELQGFYLESGHAALFQALLVHGIAGMALAGMAAALPSQPASRRLRRWALASGIGAAGTSLAQAMAGAVAALGTGAMAAEETLALTKVVDRLDSIKLLLIAVFVAAATMLIRRAGFTSIWPAATAALVIPTLVAGAVAFFVPEPALDLALAGALVLLLAWASGLAWTAWPRRTRGAATRRP